MANTQSPRQEAIQRTGFAGVRGGLDARPAALEGSERKGKKAMRTNVRCGLGMMIGLAVMFCAANPQPAVAAEAFGRLTVYGAVEASYLVEASNGQYTALGQGVAESGSLRAAVIPGETTVRVRKANSRSGAYTLVVGGGPQEIRIGGLSYDTPVTINIPEASLGAALTLSVLPE